MSKINSTVAVAAVIAAGLFALAGAAGAVETSQYHRGTEWLCESTPQGAQNCCGIPPEAARPKARTYQMAVEQCRKMNRLFVETATPPRPHSWRDDEHDYRGCWVEQGAGVRCPEDKAR